MTSKFILLCLAFEEGYYLYFLLYSTSEILSEENIIIENEGREMKEEENEGKMKEEEENESPKAVLA